jgi:hypothetical protein
MRMNMKTQLETPNECISVSGRIISTPFLKYRILGHVLARIGCSCKGKFVPMLN